MQIYEAEYFPIVGRPLSFSKSCNIYMYVLGVSFFRVSPIVFQLKPSKPFLNVTSNHETIHDNLQHGSYRRSPSLHSRPGLLWAYLSSKLIGVVIQSPFKKLLKSQLYLFYAYSLDQPSGISYIGWQHLTTHCPLEVHIEFKWDPREILLQSCAVPKILPSWFTGCKPRWSHGDGFHSKGLLTQLGLGVWLPSIPSAKAAGFNVESQVGTSSTVRLLLNSGGYLQLRSFTCFRCI